MLTHSRSNRIRLQLQELESRLTPAPVAPTIINPALDSQPSANSMRLEIDGTNYSDPDVFAHAATNWAIQETPANGGATVWQSVKTDPTGEIHVSFSDGTFVGTLVGQNSLLPNHTYDLVVTVTDTAGLESTASVRPFTTLPQDPVVPGAGEWITKPGYRVETVAQEGDFRLPTKMAFVPHPGSNPKDPLFYVTELYGSIEVVTNDGTVSTYATSLLDYNPQGPIAGTGEQGLTGICVDPATGDLFITLLWDNGNPALYGNHYPKIERLHSTDGGMTMTSSTLVKNFEPEAQGQAHQISEISIGPDGKLYVDMGDAFNAKNGEDLTTDLGKILRLNVDGSAPTDNPFYDPANPNSPTSYIYSYGHRNPFGSTWRYANNTLYVGETGNTIDHVETATAGKNLGYDGNDKSMFPYTLYDFDPSTVPSGVAIVQSQTFGGSLFPASDQDSLFVAQFGPTGAVGVQPNGKRIDEFTNLDSVDANGKLAAPTTLVKYNGTGRYTIESDAAGPDGLYFTTLFPDSTNVSPTSKGGSIFRVRYVGFEPTNVQAAAGTNSATLTWTANSLASSYNVYSQAVDGTITRVASGITGTKYTVTGLSGSGVYTFFIRGVNTGGESDNSASVLVNLGAGSGSSTTNGLLAEYFHLPAAPQDIPDLTSETADFSRVETSPNYLDAGNQPWSGLDASFTNNYAARFSGTLVVPTTGSYTFYTISDDGSRLYIDNQLLVDNGGLHGYQEVSGSITLGVGQHSIRLEYFQAGGNEQLQLTWAGPGFDRQLIPTADLFATVAVQNQPPTVATPASAGANPVAGTPLTLSVLGADDSGESNLTYQWSAVVTPTGATSPSFSDNGTNSAKNTSVSGLVAGNYTFRVTITDSQGLSAVSTVNVTVAIVSASTGTNGLLVEYFHLGDAPQDIPDFTGKTADFSRVETSPNYLGAGNRPWSGLDASFTNTYAARFSGTINIPTTGSYTFYTDSDDGSRLYIDNQLVVDNGGLHGYREVSSTISLSAGQHSIRLEYFQAYGNEQLQLTWAGPGFDRQLIPTVDLFPTVILPPVNQPPTVATPATAGANPIAGSPLNLSVLGADDGGETNLTYNWSALVTPAGAALPGFSDNGTNTAKNTSVSVLVAGNYTFRVTLTDVQYLSATSTVNVTVVAPLPQNQPPTIASPATPSGAMVAGSPLNLSVLGADDGSEPNLTYLWAAVITPPGAVAPLFSANGSNAAKNTLVSGLVAGSYTFRVTVTDAQGLSTSSTVGVVVAAPANQAPTIVNPAASGANPASGLPLSLTFLAADDGGENNLTYQWSAVVKPTGATAPNFVRNGNNAAKNTSVTGLVAGTYTFRVMAFDAQGLSVTSTVTVTVAAGGGTVNQPPTVVTPASAGAKRVAGQPLTLSVLGADDGGEPNLIYEWETVVRPAFATADPIMSVNGTNAAKNTTATGLIAGYYTFRVTIHDGPGLFVTSLVSVLIGSS